VVKNISRIGFYFARNPSVVFFIAVILLLIVCAILVTFRQEGMANWVAKWVYIFLIIGVFIDWYRLIRNR